MRPSIYQATVSDIPRIVAMGTDFLRSSDYRHTYLESPAHIAALAQRLIESPEGDVLLLVVADRIVGMIGIMAYDHFISGQRTAGEVVYWVDPSARGNGLRLLRAAEQWARTQGAEVMQMISPTPRVDELYQRLGYMPIERTFQRTL